MRKPEEKSNSWLKRLIYRLMWWKRPADAPAAIEAARGMVQMLVLTSAEEYSCEDAYLLLDQFAEAVASGESVAELMPLVQRHLEICKDCREEFEALLRVVLASKDA